MSRRRMWLLTGASLGGLGVAAAGAVSAADYHGQLSRARRALADRQGAPLVTHVVREPPPGGPAMLAVTRTWTEGRLSGTVTDVAAVDVATGQVSVRLTAALNRVRPGTGYYLVGYDCTTDAAPIGGSGLADAAGAATLALGFRSAVGDLWLVDVGVKGADRALLQLDGRLGEGRLRVPSGGLDCPR